MARGATSLQRQQGAQLPHAGGPEWRATVAGAALVYVSLRLVSAVVILLAQRDQPPSSRLSSTPYLGMTMHWDALWFRTIALAGYPHVLPLRPDGSIAQNQWAFLPGFPFATRAVMQLTDTPFPVAASLLTLCAGVVAASAIALLVAMRIPRPAALAVVAVWAALPMAPTLQLAYSEALAMALLSLALLWLVQEQWVRATVAALLLGLTRPILPPLAVVVGVAAWRRWHRRASDPIGAAEGRRMLVAVLLAGAGSAAWPAIAWWVTGVPGAYPRTEASWHRGNLSPFAGVIALLGPVRHGHLPWVRLLVIAAVCVAIALTVAALWSPRLDPLLVTWSVAYLVFELAVGNMHASELRMLLPLFPLAAVAVGVASARLARHWRRRAWLGVCLGIVGQYAWVMLFLRYLPGANHAP